MCPPPGPWCRTFLISVSAVLAFLNWLGLTLVGGLAVGFTVVILVPFVLLIIIGAPQVDPNNWTQVDLTPAASPEHAICHTALHMVTHP